MQDNEKDEQILRLIKAKGPLLPVHIVKDIGWNTLLIGAALSDLSKKGLIKMSYAKIGGSPIYYVTGQEFKLQNLYKHLHEKEQKAYDLEQKVYELEREIYLLRMDMDEIEIESEMVISSCIEEIEEMESSCFGDAEVEKLVGEIKYGD